MLVAALSLAIPSTASAKAAGKGDAAASHVAAAKAVAPLKHPALLVKAWNPFRPSWGEPYVELAARMKTAIDDVRAAARGHEAVIVSHQAPIWTVRCAYEGRRFLHDPRKRECTLASLTSLTWVGDDLLSVSYSEPAASLLALAQPGAGA